MNFETEVDSTLAEMRQHLRAAEGPRGARPVPPPRRGALSQLEAELSVTERTWNRLPPILSNRRGLVARVELWIKRAIKRATRWLTWEQVNFNSAVNRSLRATHVALSDHERQLAELRAQLEQLSARAEEFESLRREIESLRRASGRSGQGS